MRPRFRFVLRLGFWIHTGFALLVVASFFAFAESARAHSFSLAFAIAPILTLSIAAFWAIFIVDYFLPTIPLFFHRKIGWENKRLNSLGARLVTSLNVQGKVKFGVRRRYSGAYTVGHSVIVGDRAVRMLDDRQLEAVVGHELTHIVKRHFRKRSLWLVALMIPVALLFSFRYPWLPSSITAMVAMPLLILLFIPVNWGTEDEADSGGAEIAGPENMAMALLRLTGRNIDESSITHSSTARRVRRIRRQFGQAH